MEARRRCQVLWHWSYRWLWTSMWMLGTELGPSARAPSAKTLNHWAISLAPADVFLINSEIFCQLSLQEEVTINNPGSKGQDLLWPQPQPAWMLLTSTSVLDDLTVTKGSHVRCAAGFWDRVLLCSSGWSPAHHPSLSALAVLGSWAWPWHQPGFLFLFFLPLQFEWCWALFHIWK